MSTLRRLVVPFVWILPLLFFYGCGDDDGQQQQCGDGVCEGTETVASCPADCEPCGNGVLDPGEACDGTDLGGATCDSLGHNAGTLHCNADCTINDVASCCDHTCATVGETQCASAMVQACELSAMGCRDWVDQDDCGVAGELCLVRDDVASCEETCVDQCSAQDDTQCTGAVIQVCAPDAVDGCLYWADDTDCAATGELCEDALGTAECVDSCIDECTTVGDEQCNADALEQCQAGADLCNDWVVFEDCTAAGEGCNDTTGQPFCCADACLNPGETRCSSALDTIEVCGVGAEGCTEWQVQSDCGAGLVCQPVGGTPQCVTAGGESCADPLPLILGANNVAWTATTADYLTANPSCLPSSYSVAGPDVVMFYTATVNGFLDFSVINKPTNTRWVMVASSGVCGQLTPEESCVSEYGPTTMVDNFAVNAGQTYFFYIADTSSGTNPLSNPFDIVLSEIDCANPIVTVLSTLPAAGAVDVWPNAPVTVNFSNPMATNIGTVTLTGTGGTNLNYDLSLSPSEVVFSNNDTTMTVTPTSLFQTGETVTVTVAGQQDALCAGVVTSTPWAFDVASSVPPGDECNDPIVLQTGDATYYWFAGVADYFTTTPCGTSYSVDGPDVVGEFTASVNGYVSIVMQKPASNRMFMAAYEAPCGDLSAQAACINDFSPTSLNMQFPVVSGQSYYVYFADTTSGTLPLPNPLDLNIVETDCSPIPAGVALGETPLDGATDVLPSVPMSVSFDKAVRPNYGSVSVTGDQGTSYTYDLTTAPAEVVFSNGDQTMTITVPANFGLAETITVSWSGLLDAECGKTIAPIAWAFTTVASLPPGEDCADPLALTTGAANYVWYAGQQDYFTTTPCGTSYSVDGGDVVGVFTASVTGFLSVTMTKPASNRMFLAVYDSPCGDLTSQVGCLNDYTPALLNVTIPVTAGTDYYVYFGDTTSGTQPLPNPLDLVVTEIDCATFGAQAITLQPTHGGLTQSLSPSFTVDFDVAVATTAGTVTLTGDQGTSLSYTVATAAEVAFSNGDMTMTINPGVPFPAGENITITWSGMTDSLCGNGVVAPPWDVTIITPPCQPGAGGIVGTTQTIIPSGLTTTSEYYVAADDDPNGWVYVGGTTSLYRVPKAGGTSEDVYALAGLSGTQVGYAMLINGLDIFTIEATTTGTTGKLWRISSDGGATWVVEDFATFPVAPADDIRAATVWNGRIYMVTSEGTSTVPTEIWSVSATPATLPDTAVLAGGFTGEVSCSGLAADDYNFYVSCSTGERVIRVAHADAPNYQSVLVTDAVDNSATSNSLYTADTNSDGVADVLYVHGYEVEVWYVCDPSGVAFVDLLTTVGSVNYGMGYDAVANRLWFYDDLSKDFVSLQ